MRKRSTRRAFAWYVVLRGRSPPPAPPGPEVLLPCWFFWTILLLFFFWLTLLLLFFWRVLLGPFARQRLPRPRRVRACRRPDWHCGGYPPAILPRPVRPWPRSHRPGPASACWRSGGRAAGHGGLDARGSSGRAARSIPARNRATKEPCPASRPPARRPGSLLARSGGSGAGLLAALGGCAGWLSPGCGCGVGLGRGVWACCRFGWAGACGGGRLFGGWAGRVVCDRGPGSAGGCRPPRTPRRKEQNRKPSCCSSGG